MASAATASVEAMIVFSSMTLPGPYGPLEVSTRVPSMIARLALSRVFRSTMDWSRS